MSSIREKIIEAGLAEATPAPYGKVSDQVLDGQGKRAGWRVLKSYFDEAVYGWPESNWQGRGKIKPPGKDWVTITYLEGVQKPTYRVPQPSKESGVSWCGIFATWVLRKAGLGVYWKTGVGISGSQVVTVAGKEGYQRGDVLVFTGTLADGMAGVHHAIFVDEDHKIYGGNGSIRTINGNSDYQSITVHSKFYPSQIWYYYRILD
jgi:hypothetical protein